MNVIIAGEHYDPILGGTTYLLKKNVNALSALCNHITVIVPSTDNQNITEEIGNVRIIKIGIGSEYKIDLSKDQRMAFIYKFNELLPSLMKERKWDVFHVLTGVYLLKHLNFNIIKENSTKTVATIINVPPQECGQSWKGDNFLNRTKDYLRKLVIKYVNKERITHNNWDEYVTISECGKRLLAEYISPERINVVHLGCDKLSSKKPVYNDSTRLNLLTIGGYVSHKNQHILADVALHLKKRKINFSWILVGPVRDKRYFDFVQKKIQENGVKESFTVIESLSREELYQLYINCNIYVQPSLEEGFCMTALDAVLLGRPLIGISQNSGAIADFVRLGKGKMCKNRVKELAAAIEKINDDINSYRYNENDILNIEKEFLWENVAKGYYDIYSK